MASKAITTISTTVSSIWKWLVLEEIPPTEEPVTISQEEPPSSSSPSPLPTATNPLVSIRDYVEQLLPSGTHFQKHKSLSYTQDSLVCLYKETLQ